MSATDTPAFSLTEESREKLAVFAEALGIVEENYVEPRDLKKLIYGAIRGMVSSLDSHSAFMAPEEFKELQIETKGSFSGIGIEITLKDNLLIVVSPIEGTPAYRAGLQAGDRIIKIDGQSTKNMSLLDAVRKIRGAKGSMVTLTIMRENVDKPKTFALVREIIPIRSVRVRHFDDGIGYIRITNFQDKTDHDLQQAITDLHAKFKPLRGLILDLRNDPGGLLDQAIKVADEFLTSGLIVYTEGRNKNQNNRFYAQDNGSELERSIPLVILINEGSASASEIVAGALQDRKRATLVGTKTFGKGSVQSIVPLEDGSALRLTTAYYYTPSGRVINEKGIQPDLLVEMPAMPEGKSVKALRQEALERRMRGEDLADKAWTVPISAAELEKDPQLARAVQVLRQGSAAKTAEAKR
ncbi:MAG: S41 family peptidase [Desulfobacca sp.]|uniref:S41 family peptidase n=1 Tax=Desulfobacca sp. TaxID=2067990 RepID=UPI00404AECFA